MHQKRCRTPFIVLYLYCYSNIRIKYRLRQQHRVDNRTSSNIVYSRLKILILHEKTESATLTIVRFPFLEEIEHIVTGSLQH